nr:MAG TPA: hypothetical protein [Caudoviricetes sp.]
MRRLGVLVKGIHFQDILHKYTAEPSEKMKNHRKESFEGCRDAET